MKNKMITLYGGILFLLCIGYSFTFAQSFVEEFDLNNNLWTSGWDSVNHSTTPGPPPCWNQTGMVYGGQYSGPTGSAMWADYQDIFFPGTINAWLIAPTVQFNNNDEIHFYTMSADTFYGSHHPDRLQLRLSSNGGSSYVGVGDTAVGDFTDLLLDINPLYLGVGYPQGYPYRWQHYVVTISGLTTPFVGRFAFRYFVENARAGHGQVLGIDSVAFVSHGEGSVVNENLKRNIHIFQSSNSSKLYGNGDFSINGVFTIYNSLGSLVEKGFANKLIEGIDISMIQNGLYLIAIDNYSPSKFIVQH